jgi:hypothetical protein
MLATACQPAARLSGSAKSHSIEPVAQQVKVADRAGFAGQDEEDGLKGIFGMVVVAQELAADAQDHGSVAAHQRGESCFTSGIAAGIERGFP